MDMDGEPSVSEFKMNLFLQYPRLEALSSMYVAVNSAYADEAATLGEEDEIALIPPVSGG